MPSRPPAVRSSIVGLAAAALLAGCTVVPGGTPSPTVPLESASPSAPVPTFTPSGDVSPSPGDDEATPSWTGSSPVASPTENETSGGSPSAEPSASPGLTTVQPGDQVRLTAQTAFRSDGWTDSTAQPAGAAAPVPVLTAVISCLGGPPELEYRFPPSRGTVRLVVAQDILSRSSDNTLEFLLVADGKQVATKAITFKQQAELGAPLTGVTSLKVVVRPKGACKDNATALITEASAKG